MHINVLREIINTVIEIKIFQIVFLFLILLYFNGLAESINYKNHFFKFQRIILIGNKI